MPWSSWPHSCEEPSRPRRECSAFPLGLFRDFSLGLAPLGIAPKEVADIEEADVRHVADDEHGAGGLHEFEDTGVDRLAPDRLHNGEHDMPAVEDRNRQHV